MARGTIEKRGSNSWRLNVSMVLGANGKYKRKRKTVKARNKTEGSIRKVVIPEELHNDLKKHIFDKRQEKLATEELWYDYLGDLVFSTYGHHKQSNRLTVIR